MERGGDDPRRVDFGAYATLRLGMRVEEAYRDWCEWLAEQLRAGNR